MRTKQLAALATAASIGLVMGAALMAAEPWAAFVTRVNVPIEQITLAAAVLVLACTTLTAARARAARAVSEADHRSATLDAVGEEIAWQCDAEGRFTYASTQSLAAIGYRPEEVYSLSLFDVLHPEEHTATRRLLMSGGGWRRRTFRCVAKDGSVVWLRSTAVPVYAQDGCLTGLTGASHVLEGPPTRDLLETARWVDVLRVIHDDAVIPAFQPIVALAEQRIVGVEALSRFTVPDDQRSPQDWFTDAATAGLAVDLELHALRVALRAASALPDNSYVSVNLSPETITSAALLEVFDSCTIPLTKLVVELTEHSSVEDYEQLRASLAPLRAQGLRLAVDDAGAGYASFRHILALAADVIKLDRTLICGIDSDPARQALVTAVVTFAHDRAATVVAEGIETEAELRALLGLGVDSGQGYLLGRPTTVRQEWRAWSDSGRPGRALPVAAMD